MDADRPTLPAAAIERMAAAMAARWRELAAAKVEDSPEGHCADLARVAAAALLDGCEVAVEYGIHWAGDQTPDWGHRSLEDARAVVESTALPEDTATYVRRLVLTGSAEAADTGSEEE